MVLGVISSLAIILLRKGDSWLIYFNDVVVVCSLYQSFTMPTQIRKILLGGPDKVFLKASTYFTEGRTDLPGEAIGPKWFPC